MSLERRAERYWRCAEYHGFRSPYQDEGSVGGVSAELREAPAPGFLTPAQVADDLQVARSTVHQMLHARQIPAIRVRRLWRVPRDLYEAWKRGEWQAPAPARNLVPMRRAGR